MKCLVSSQLRLKTVQGVVSHHHQGLMVLIWAFGMAFGSIKESGLSPRRLPGVVVSRTLRALVGDQGLIRIGDAGGVRLVFDDRTVLGVD